MSYIEHVQFCRVVEPGLCCCVEIDGALPVGLKIFPKLWQDLDGFEASLSQVLPHLRKQRLNKVAEHIHSCPICQQCVWILLDGKQGARRFICAGLEGHRTFADLGVSIYTGCMNHAGSNDVFCKRCRPSSLQQSALIAQEKRYRSKLVHLKTVCQWRLGTWSVASVHRMASSKHLCPARKCAQIYWQSSRKGPCQKSEIMVTCVLNFAG